MAKARIWLAGVAVLVGVAILLGLGTWQVARLQWKTALISDIEARLNAEPVAFPAQVRVAVESLQFQRVRLTGRFDHDHEYHLLSRTRGGVAGVHLMTPLEVAPGQFVLVNRGWVPDPLGPGIARPVGEVTVEGVIRLFQEPTRFTPRNDPAGNAWFLPDRAAMARAAGLDRVAPVYVSVIDQGGSPAGDPPGVNLRNNHLGYAITWYGLAVALIAVAGFAVLRKNQHDTA